MLRRGRKRAAGIQSSFRWDNPRSKRSCPSKMMDPGVLVMNLKTSAVDSQ